MYDGRFNPYEEAIDVDTFELPSTQPPALPPPRYDNKQQLGPPPPYTEEFVHRMKGPAPPVPTNRPGSGDSSESPWSTSPSPSNPPALPRRVPPTVTVDNQAPAARRQPYYNVSIDDETSWTGGAGGLNTDHSAVHEGEHEAKKHAKKTPFRMILQRPFAKQKQRPEREEMSHSESEDDEKKTSRTFEYRQSISDVTQSISEVTQRVGGTLSRLVRYLGLGGIDVVLRVVLSSTHVSQHRSSNTHSRVAR